MNKLLEIIQELMEEVIRVFNRQEHYLIYNNLCERCINGRFAMYMQYFISNSVLSGYLVDVEWDRGMAGNDCFKKKYKDGDAYLDLIVHKRGYDSISGYDNLIVVEMKKEGPDFEEDKERLRDLASVQYGFGYRAGYALRIKNDGIVCEDSFFLLHEKTRTLCDLFQKVMKKYKNIDRWGHFFDYMDLENIMLARWLSENDASSNIKLLEGTRNNYNDRHIWIELSDDEGDTIIDLTGSRFEDCSINTYVGPMNSFHKSFTNKRIIQSVGGNIEELYSIIKAEIQLE